MQNGWIRSVAVPPSSFVNHHRITFVAPYAVCANGWPRCLRERPTRASHRALRNLVVGAVRQHVGREGTWADLETEGQRSNAHDRTTKREKERVMTKGRVEEKGESPANSRLKTEPLLEPFLGEGNRRF